MIGLSTIWDEFYDSFYEIYEVLLGINVLIALSTNRNEFVFSAIWLSHG